MPAAANVSLAGLSGPDRHQVESLLVQFDRSWDENRLATCVQSLPRDCAWRLAALVEMVKIDLERQWRNSRQPRVEAYLHFYPELATAGSAVAELLLAEYQAREGAGQTADLADFAHRFPNQADALRQLVNQKRASASAVNAAGKQTAGSHVSTHLGGQPATPANLPQRFGRYRIVKKLGEGGMGAVYLAEDTQLHRQVALKVPRLGKKGNTAVLERFLREARAAATLRHANICPVHDVGEVEGVPYLTMAYIEGRPLSLFLRPDKPLPQRQGVLLVRKLALALQKAHEQGVVHRDLKPSNIMIDQQREPVIMDFGLAQRVNTGDARLTRVGSVLGTPAYMSPEQARGEVEAMGPCCDVYSLGVILYECLTGRLPFEGPPQVVIANVLTQVPPRPCSLRAGVDPRVEAVCLKAMAKKPEDRLPSMQVFADELGQYLAAPRLAAMETMIPNAPAQQTVEADENPFGGLGPEKDGVVAVPIRKPAVGGPPRNRSILALGVAGAAAVIALVFGIIFLLPAGEHGTIKIELADGVNDVRVTVDGGVISLAGLDEPVRLKAGEHAIEVQGKNYKTFTRKIHLTRGGKEVVKVTLEQVNAPPPSILFQSLFNGKDLTDWKSTKVNKTEWKVEKGLLVGPSERGTLIYQGKEYRNFHLRIEGFSEQPGMGMVGVRVRDLDEDAKGYCVILPRATDNMEQKAGQLGRFNGRLFTDYVDLVNPRLHHAKVNEWYKMEVIAKEAQITVRVNDVTVVEYTDKEYPVVPGRVGLFRSFGQWSINFRKIEIQELASPDP